MKILFYIEPHPIRESYTMFNNILRWASGMLRDEYVHKKHAGNHPVDIRMLVSRHYTPILKEIFDGVAPVMGLTKEENDAVQNYKAPWDNAAIDTWKELMRGEGAVSDLYKSILTRIHKSFDFDVIVYWGANGAVRSFAAENSLYAVAMELGCTRVPFLESVYFDPFGVNGDAYTQYVDLKSVPAADLDLVQASLPIACEYGRQLDALHNPLQTRFAKDIYENYGKNILIPLQLDDDSNLLIHSEYESYYALLQDVLPSLTAAGYRCYIKPHPGVKARAYNVKMQALSAAYCEQFENVFWLDDVINHRDYLSLFDKMDYVLTINSSVGFEALLFNKKVIPMGRSPYNLDGIFPTVEDVVNGDFDEKKYQKNIAKIVNLVLYHYLYPKRLAFDFNFFVTSIARACRLYDIYLGDGRQKFTAVLLAEKSFDPLLYAPFLDQEFNTRMRYKKAPKKSSLPVLVPQGSTKKGRKINKLKRDPHLFFCDAKFPPLRLLALFFKAQ
ncbi:MAG: capsular polysaccharide export protein, LipB/KpsS family [Alphaproteobacteria bacterium]